MLKTEPVIVDYQAITPYGKDINICWQGLLNNKTSITNIERFDTSNFTSSKAATIKDLIFRNRKSIVFQMLEKLKKSVNQVIPEDADLMLASLNGEINFLEEEMLTGNMNTKQSCLGQLLEKTR
ncbi:MAG: hypothetical protein KAJ14_15160, partial [Candidatus Omnitrophica bacterium]|nr:hypothetical protein [Candidatus Omnitrophota bacterium]